MIIDCDIKEWRISCYNIWMRIKSMNYVQYLQIVVNMRVFGGLITKFRVAETPTSCTYLGRKPQSRGRMLIRADSGRTDHLEWGRVA